jgi:hypothetical protein
MHFTGKACTTEGFCTEGVSLRIAYTVIVYLPLSALGSTHKYKRTIPLEPVKNQCALAVAVGWVLQVLQPIFHWRWPLTCTRVNSENIGCGAPTEC